MYLREAKGENNEYRAVAVKALADPARGCKPDRLGVDLATFLVQCLNAVQYGLLLFLVASGLTLIFGIMGVINLAHGSFYMIGAWPSCWRPGSATGT